MKFLEIGKIIFNLVTFIRLANHWCFDSSLAPTGYQLRCHSTVLSDLQQNNLVFPYIPFVSSRGLCKQWNCSVVWDYLYSSAWSYFSLFFRVCILSGNGMVSRLFQHNGKWSFCILSSTKSMPCHSNMATNKRWQTKVRTVRNHLME